jgi:putative membrane-bound dehydrogenase-like protein
MALCSCVVLVDIAAAAPPAQKVNSRKAGDAVAGLDVAKGLEATLFASEPAITSLTNLDVDSRGRVWVCEVVNYRKNRGRRKAGDRILILEDTNGDGRSDKQTVYYQGQDIDSAMGICVLGNRVIVSCSPNVLVFTDIDGDDKPDRKQPLFTRTGQPQHDHSAHSILFGPDGKLYWNFGNTGKAVHDYKGDPITDLAGNKVVDNGRPYYGGMPFRCDPDGGRFEVLAHNFRNNYEITVDSFGTLWQSDNDDDGNRAVRINFVMEFGNFGYRSQLTGAGWRAPRTGMHREVPIRHWHQNDPGVIPNLLQTGAGSPTGITVYEGRLLPKIFHGQVIHCDAGPNVVRAYPATVDGAGYKAKIVNVLKGTRDNWFRPADVCVAPDGSLFITDWYDPGVGGHNQRDLDRGRLFRVAPPGHRYRPPKIDVGTVPGAIDALKNPAFSVRYLAFTALQSMGARARGPLLQLVRDRKADPRHRARGLWVLGKSGDQAAAARAVEEALACQHPDLRIVGLRLARQIEHDVVPLVAGLVGDPSPRVRRECLVALRTSKSQRVPRLWARLAATYDGKDRWYLEALGIAADGRWDACLAAWKATNPNNLDGPDGRNIVWRSRGSETAARLAKIIIDPATPVAELPRYLRALDFQTAESRNQAAWQLVVADHGRDRGRAGLIVAEALARLTSVDLAGKPRARQAINRVADQARGTAGYVQLVARFGLADRYPDLVALAAKRPDEQTGIDAVRALLAHKQQKLLVGGLSVKSAVEATGVARALANASDARAAVVLRPLIDEAKRPLSVRREAVRGVIRGSRKEAAAIVVRVRGGRLPADLKQAAGAALVTHPVAAIRKQGLALFPPPPSKNNKPLPPIAELVKRRGKVAVGKKLFATTATCAKCHKVAGQGKEVGPDLSGIGRKLSRAAMLESVLFPSAGISHNYESYVAALVDGTVLTGLMISQTPASVTIRNVEAIDRTVKRSEIEELKKQTISLMPADLQKTMTVDDLVNVIEYLTTLRQANTTAEVKSK